MRTYCIYGILIYLAAINVAAFFLYGIIFLHRVIAAHGQLGGYAYGTEIKKQLLELEQL